MYIGERLLKGKIKQSHECQYNTRHPYVDLAILARQMYPSLPKKVMIKYTEAANKSDRYLFIDLKQNTPIEDR